MTTTLPEPTPAPDGDSLPLRASSQLDRVPEPRPEGAPPPVADASPQPPAAPEAAAAPAAPASGPAPGSWRARISQEALGRAPASTWTAGGVALLASVAWLVERRRRLILENHDSLAWASSQDAHSMAEPPTDPGGKLDALLPKGPDPAEAAARAVYASAIGDTSSRREATLIDLHQLKSKLDRRLQAGDEVAATLLLQQHLIDFRYTSPWVFLELRELYRELERPRDWDLARDAFRDRFGQNAPLWDARSTASWSLLADTPLCSEIVRKWPYRDARLFILRWMLGDPETRQRASGPPQLALGVYRDLMMLDGMLDDVMTERAPRAEALL